MTDKIQVIYIAGMMRSGSTILGRLLGELPGAVHVGELGLFPSPAFPTVCVCECRQPVASCEFWQAVFGRVGGFDALDLTSLEKTRNEYRLRTLPRRLLPQTAEQKRRLGAYLDTLGALYKAVRDVSGARIIIDGSKDPLYGFHLSQAPGLDVHLVHLVRDSRAVAFSHQRVKKYLPHSADPGNLPRSAPWQTALAWNATTLLLGLARRPRPLLLRYEDFVADPAAAVRRVWEPTGGPTPPLDFLQSPVLRLHQGHTVAGNPDRFQSEVKIKPDLEWQTKMPPADRRIVTALTAPLLLRHGYLKPKRKSDPHLLPSGVL